MGNDYYSSVVLCGDRWTPDGCAMAMAWSRGGFSVWSTFGALLVCSLGWDYGLHVDLARFNPLNIVDMVSILLSLCRSSVSKLIPLILNPFSRKVLCHLRTVVNVVKFVGRETVQSVDIFHNILGVWISLS